jgi:hypothetical protein
MTSGEIQLSLTISEVDADPERLDELTGYLLRDLRELGVESVRRSSGGPVPEGAKGAASAVGTLDTVAMPSFLPRLFGFLQSWSQRDASRAVKIKTPNGLEVEFTPEKNLTQGELLALVKELTAGPQAVDVSPSDLEQERLKPSDRTQLRQILSVYFDESELRTLCFDLGIEYDDLPGVGKSDKARELVGYLERHSRIYDLLKVGKQLRPDVPWT